jgi:hypothetical protein
MTDHELVHQSKKNDSINRFRGLVKSLLLLADALKRFLGELPVRPAEEAWKVHNT